MADLSIDPNTVVAITTNPNQVSRQYNVAAGSPNITAGMSVYLDESTTPKVWRQLSKAISLAGVVAGIAVNSAATGQALAVALNNAKVKVGAAQAEIYVAGAAGGGIAPYSDLLTGDYLIIMGYGDDGSNIVVDVKATGIAKP